jgi:hypothetical protein
VLYQLSYLGELGNGQKTRKGAVNVAGRFFGVNCNLGFFR